MVGCTTLALSAFLVLVEGFSPTWYADGKNPSIGYGHNQTGKESFLAPISEHTASILLSRDILIAHKRVRVYLRRVHDISVFSLDCRSQMALTALTYNTGSLGTHPLFTSAVVAKDWPEARKQGKVWYRREGEWLELSSRNKLFASKWLYDE